MTELPRVPTGNSPLHQFARQLLECVRERTILDHPSVIVDRTEKGVRVKARSQTVVADEAEEEEEP